MKTNNFIIHQFVFWKTSLFFHLTASASPQSHQLYLNSQEDFHCGTLSGTLRQRRLWMHFDFGRCINHQSFSFATMAAVAAASPDNNTKTPAKATVVPLNTSTINIISTQWYEVPLLPSLLLLLYCIPWIILGRTELRDSKKLLSAAGLWHDSSQWKFKE